MESAICFNKTVLPVRGGATIKARCPLPIGATKSITRISVSCARSPKRIQSTGIMGVCRSNLEHFAQVSKL